MANQKFTQFGTFTVAILVPLFILCVAMIFVPGIRDSGGVLIMGFAALTMLLCLLIFYKITITVNETTLTFSLGVGLIKKSYPVNEIKSCKPVKNFPLTGFGIRKIPNGWLYNVSGLGAIELSFKNKKSILRIGTNNPGLVSQTINEYLKSDIHGNETYERQSAAIFSSIAIFFVVILVVSILLITGSKEMSVKTDDNDFTIKGMYGMTIKYSDIVSLDTISSLPAIKLRTNGFAAGKTLKGNFLLTDKLRVKLFVTADNPPFLHFRTRSGEIYLNFKDSDKTRDLYKKLKTLITQVKN